MVDLVSIKKSTVSSENVQLQKITSKNQLVDAWSIINTTTTGFLLQVVCLPALTSEYSLVAGLSALLRRQSKTASGSGEEGARPGRWCSTLTRRVASPIVRVAPEVICWPMWGRKRGPGAQLQLRCREPGMQVAEGSSIRQEKKAAAYDRSRRQQQKK